jgi:UDP-2-acetamido-2-deoxy-ribo-hexuluronate aminotransferase
LALNIGPGDEVITTPFTWISTAEVISLTGATPVFVDIDPATYNINPDLLPAAISEQTKAIIPVDLFGQMADYTKIEAIAEEHGGLHIIEDAAQSLGATQNGRPAGSRGIIGCTSFFPAKPLGCFGDGGACFTDDPDLAHRLRAIRTHGGEKRHYHPYVGINGRLDTLQAAVLVAKLPHFSQEVEARSELGASYSRMLSDVCTVPYLQPGNTSVYAQYTIRVPNRDQVQARLKEQGIPSAIYYPKCLHEQPVFADLGYKWGEFPEAEKASREVLSLPMHPFLTQEEQEQVVSALKTCIEAV